MLLTQFVKSGMWRICGTCERLCVTRCQDDHCARWWNAFHHKSSIDRLFPASFARRNSDCDQLLFHWNSVALRAWKSVPSDWPIEGKLNSWSGSYLFKTRLHHLIVRPSSPGDFWPFTGKVWQDLSQRCSLIYSVLIEQEFFVEVSNPLQNGAVPSWRLFSLFWLAIFQTQFWTPINSLLPLISQMFFNFSRHFDPPPPSSSWFHANLLYPHRPTAVGWILPWL